MAFRRIRKQYQDKDKKKGEMNVIAIVLDSFRQDHVSFYHGGRPVFEGIAACQTPNLDAFAQECVVFENAYPEALPTIPVRTQLFTGQRTLEIYGVQLAGSEILVKFFPDLAP